MTRILFVCTGNTCRSPMAEAILKSKSIPGVEVRSAGVYAVDGSAASAHAQKVLDEQNIPHDHQSSLLTRELVDWANEIFTMTLGHKHAIISQYPDAADKTFTLREFVGDASSDISDPFGGNLEVYRHTFGEIHENIEKLVNKMNRK